MRKSDLPAPACEEVVRIRMKKLKRAYVEITNMCNLSCAFCPGTARNPRFMSIAEFEAVLKRLSGYTEYLYFHVMGEPLLHPELRGFLELSDRYGYRVNITTNGTLIRDQADTLENSKALRQVNFSLHSQEDVVDEAVLVKYLDELFLFTERVLAGSGVYISYRLWNLSSAAADKYNAYIVRKLEQYFKPDFSIMEALSRSNRIKLREGLFLNSAEVFQWPSGKADEVGDEGFCLGLRDQVAILVDGTVVPCCLDSEGTISLGNIFHKDLKEILEGSRARALYEGFSERQAVEELCKKCGYRTRF